jgi:hypothetical protein
MPILRHAPLAPLALFLLGLATVSAQADGEPAAPAKPAPPSYPIEVPVGIPVQIDGIALPAEWADAAQRPLGEDGGVFKVKQHRGTLLLAVEPHAPWIEGDRLWLCFTPDTPDAGLYRPPAVRIDYEPFAHNRYHVLAVKVAESGEVLAPGAAIARAALAGSRPTVEMGIRLPCCTSGAVAGERRPGHPASTSRRAPPTSLRPISRARRSGDASKDGRTPTAPELFPGGTGTPSSRRTRS